MRCAVALFSAIAVATVYGQDHYGGSYGHGGLEIGGGHGHVQEYIDYRAVPRYHFNYDVHDPKNHDIKSQHEVRDGHETKGRYELLQPDGRRRIVEYVAGKHGANYNVRYEGHSQHGGYGAQQGGYGSQHGGY
ncbi:adult-specific cuticular protein ACP-22-like [Diabrotica virgifera virgifera]|uniref:Adult-specific cuticular protein ACP-20-like n=1 Tax=Diabrotica virgifera virgifera TaxID=50390 RepID=A0ABM5IW76_DIAVI|nr:adult-specific cuticular protein ACP-22-like [Diabrotica virgifera virgifera]